MLNPDSLQPGDEVKANIGAYGTYLIFQKVESSSNKAAYLFMVSSTKNFFFRFNRDQVSRFSLHRSVLPAPPLVRCYQCDDLCRYLFPDARCVSCTHVLPEEL